MLELAWKLVCSRAVQSEILESLIDLSPRQKIKLNKCDYTNFGLYKFANQANTKIEKILGLKHKIAVYPEYR